MHGIDGGLCSSNGSLAILRFLGSGLRFLHNIFVLLALPRQSGEQRSKTLAQTRLRSHNQFSFLLASIACSTVGERRAISNAASQ